MKQAEKIKKFARHILTFVWEKPEKILLLLCVFGLLYSVFLVFLPKQPVYYSVLYLEPGYYGESRIGLFARFGIENHEQQDFNYTASFFLESLKDDNSFDSVLLAEKNYFVRKDENFSGFASFEIPESFKGQKNLRLRIQTSAFGTDYSVHFWPGH